MYFNGKDVGIWLTFPLTWWAEREMLSLAGSSPKLILALWQARIQFITQSSKSHLASLPPTKIFVSLLVHSQMSLQWHGQRFSSNAALKQHLGNEKRCYSKIWTSACTRVCTHTHTHRSKKMLTFAMPQQLSVFFSTWRNPASLYIPKQEIKVTSSENCNNIVYFLINHVILKQ